jgi:hypothetical protein
VSAPVNDKSVICDGLCAADCGCIDCRSCEGCGDCGRGPTDVSDLPEVIRSYPVIVEETRRYVLWLDGESPADAVAQFTDEPYAPEPGAMFRFDWTAEVPDDFDWDRIEYPGDGGEWPGMLADAHVRTWRNHVYLMERKAAKAACSAAGHPVPARKVGRTWPDYCDTCGQIDPGERTATDPSAVGGEPKATSKDASDLGGDVA